MLTDKIASLIITFIGICLYLIIYRRFFYKGDRSYYSKTNKLIISFLVNILITIVFLYFYSSASYTWLLVISIALLISFVFTCIFALNASEGKTNKLYDFTRNPKNKKVVLSIIGFLLIIAAIRIGFHQWQKPTNLKTYMNTAYDYQFDYSNDLISISAVNREVIKPLTDSEAKTTNNLVVGTSSDQDILQVLVVRNQDEAAATFRIQKLNDTSIWTAPSKVKINGIEFSKYVIKKGAYNGQVEAYYGLNGINYFYLGLFDKTEGNKILSTFKFTN